MLLLPLSRTGCIGKVVAVVSAFVSHAAAPLARLLFFSLTDTHGSLLLHVRRYKPCTIDHIYHLFPKDKKK